MRIQPTRWLCVLGLGLAATLFTAGVAPGQTAAEYRARTEASKQWPREAVRGAKAMVATDEELGSKAGVEILKRGGNAVDAAVGVAVSVPVGGTAAGDNWGGGVFVGWLGYWPPPIF